MIIAYHDSIDGRSKLYVVSRSLGGAWSPPRMLADNTSGSFTLERAGRGSFLLRFLEFGENRKGPLKLRELVLKCGEP